MDFLERAQTTIQKGVPVIRLRPKTKVALDNDWPSLATTDLETIQRWNTESPDANCAAVAKAVPGGVWFFEVDAPEVVSRLEQETGQQLPKTYRVRSRPGRGHFYFRHTPESIALGNISQSYVKNGDFSVRVDNQYVVSANSLHPISEKPYEIVSTADITEAPAWLIDWLASQKLTEKPDESGVEIPRNSTGLVPHGSIHGYMLKEAGRLRQTGLNASEIEPVLLRLVHENCQPPIDDAKIRQMAKSVEKYEVKDMTILVGGKIPVPDVPEVIQPEDMEEQASFVVPPYPKFPKWAIEQTSLYRGLVEPYCAVNSRYPEFMWIPAATLMMNFLGTKVRIQNKNVIPSLFVVLIGQKGRVIKSSSVNDAITYLKYAGVVDQAGTMTRNAEGKSLIWTAGSPEGLGLEAQRTNCKNIVLFYDELSSLTSKAGIESSTLISCLLNIYESGQFANTIKARKETYSLEPGSYCASLIACCTDKNFKTLWGKMSGVTSGLNDRFFFLYQPEFLKPVTPPIAVDTSVGAIETRKLIDKAVQQGVYSIVDSSPLAHAMNGPNALENRQEIRAEKFALYFAIDLGRDEIDEDCIERGLAVVEYERAVKRRLRPSEALTKEAQIQNEIVDFLLGQQGGMATHREITRVLHPERYGTSLWGQAFTGLIRSGQIVSQGKGTKSDPKMVILLRAPEETED